MTKTSLATAVLTGLSVIGGVASAQDGQREPFGAYGGGDLFYYGDAAANSQADDATIASLYYGRNFLDGHVEAHLDYAFFDDIPQDDTAYRVQLSYSPERLSRTEVAFYIARSFFDRFATDVTEYGITSDTILSPGIELYLSGGVFDANGEHEFGGTAAVDFLTTDRAETEFAVSYYDGHTVGQTTVSFFLDNGIGLSAAALVDDDGDAAAAFGLSYRFGVDRSKFRPTVTPLEMAILF
ncbi:MAG: hypothetical protein AAFR98_11195 [Pseudomonadota bacterium]